MSVKALTLAIKIMIQAGAPARRGIDEAESAIGKMQNRFAKMSHAREVLGVRSERAIQREIKLTEAAYNRLERSGTASARETGRAYDAMREKVRELRREMQGVTRTQKALSFGKNVVAPVGAGVAAGAYVLAQPIKKVMDYDRSLAMASNTIFSDRKAPGRISGMSTINAAVEDAVRVGGGDRAGALEALNSLFSSGALGEGDAGRRAAFSLLATIQKYHTGTGAESSDLAAIASKAKGFGIGVTDMPYALDMAIAGGNAGGMEISDQAKWLPNQMASAAHLGMSGTRDFAKLVAINQAAFLGAGSTDEAGNNVRNLLNKFSSTDTAKDFAKQGINVSNELAKGRANGQDAIDVIMSITDRVVGKDKRYTHLQQKLATTTDKDARRALIESQAAIIQGSAIGKVMQDQQAASALAAILANRDFIRGLTQTEIGAKGLGNDNHATVASTASYQAERWNNESQFAQRNALEGLTHVIGSAAGKMADYAQRYPALTTALSGATTALSALAAAGTGAAATQLLMRVPGGAGAAAQGAIGGSTVTGIASKWGGRLLPYAMRAGVAAELMLHSDSLGKDRQGNQLDTLDGMRAAMDSVALKSPDLNNARKTLAESNAAYGRKFDLSGKIKVDVDLKNNTATVTPDFQDRRLQQAVQSGRTMPTVSTGIRG